MTTELFRKVGSVSNTNGVKDQWKTEIKRCHGLVNDILEDDKRDLMLWLLNKPQKEHNDILAMRSIRKTCNYIG